MRTQAVLFIVENNNYPDDIRVFNEVNTVMDNLKCKVFVISPSYSFRENKYVKYSDNISNIRYPSFNGRSNIGYIAEYLNSLLWITIYTIFLVMFLKIKVIHVANPPDIVIPAISFSKLFGAKIIFDMHDLSVETFNSKGNSNYGIINYLINKGLIFFEKLSIKISNVVITTNNSILNHVKHVNKEKKTFVVRNSNNVIYKDIKDIVKRKTGIINIGYFGRLSCDNASGYKNILLLADEFEKMGVNYVMTIIGNGSGISKLKNAIKNTTYNNKFIFKGFINFYNAHTEISQFDFGIVPWPNNTKNNLHTAAKVMDYMCCGVPVCSLNLKEQMITTNGIGVHCENFIELAKDISILYSDEYEYEKLRRKTLDYFNEKLRWELQERNIIRAYNYLGVSSFEFIFMVTYFYLSWVD